MWKMSGPWWHCCVRAACIYFFLLIVLRITGKRQVGQLAPFDLILLLVLSNAVQNAMIGNDVSVPGGCITAATLIALNYFVGFCTFRSKFLEGLIEGRPIRLIHDGQVNKRNLYKVRMTIHELNAALRSEGIGCVDDVQFAILENTGKISVVGKKKNGNGNGGGGGVLPDTAQRQQGHP